MKQNEFQFEFTGNHIIDARKVISIILKYLPPIRTFLDFGCGLGAFSKAFEDFGYSNFKMIDHPSLPTEKLLVQDRTKFQPVDLDSDIPSIERVDLVICIEVLEHFENGRSLQLLDFITNSSDVVLFSAAVPRQLGTGHINEQWHDFWHFEFKKRGFSFFDGFKSELILDESIVYCFRQNLFIYYKNDLSNFFNNSLNVTSEKLLLVSEHILKRPYGFVEIVNMLPGAITRSFWAFLARIF